MKIEEKKMDTINELKFKYDLNNGISRGRFSFEYRFFNGR